MDEQGKKTHLYRFHAQNGKIVPFAGFQMPVSYKGIIPEHMAVRTGVGLFDVTHMGRVVVTGTNAEAFLNYVTTNDVARLVPLTAHYSVMCNEEGGIKDDFVLSRQKEDRFFMVYNAANRLKNFQWLTKQAANYSVNITDVSDDVAMFAVQGPKAEETLQKVVTKDLSEIARFKCSWTKLSGFDAFMSRTGYTGEDGFEVFIHNTPISNPRNAIVAWNTILEAGKEFNIEPCGLGARDTLRLEAGMCLYGNDIDENVTPLEARISFVVKLKKEDFIGKEALIKQKTHGVEKKRVGLKVLESGIPRFKHEVFKDRMKIGYITSGTFSPLLKRGIAMAYIQSKYAVIDEIVHVKIRSKQIKAQLIKFPFYDPGQYGHTRKK
ncbi:MAG: glycine cleavage system aminomethyltransferase GcvT [Candidatus Bathyarchaeota archaeon]|nr:MAG: glycine cleavage system aminomethyltransferase GcvT [Candidatus Bathyarchaeota archaeon]